MKLSSLISARARARSLPPVTQALIASTGGVGSEKNDVVLREGGVGLEGRLINSELIGGESIGLTRAEDGDHSQLLDGSDKGNVSLVFDELLSIDGEGDGAWAY